MKHAWLSAHLEFQKVFRKLKIFCKQLNKEYVTQPFKKMNDEASVNNQMTQGLKAINPNV